MKFLNNGKEYFTHFFGEEALELIEGHDDVNIVIAKAGMFPAVEQYGAIGGFVVLIDTVTYEVLPKDSTNRELALVLYPEHIHNDCANLPADIRDKVRRSMVVHELVHVRQVKEGRLKQETAGEIFWEGEVHNLTNLTGYVSWGWEREAYMEQMLYIADGDKTQAEKGYAAMCGQ